MLGILTILILGGLVIVGFTVWAWINRRSVISRAERKELSRLRLLVDTLYDQAADHVTLGEEPFATIAFDEIRQARKELQ